jgi:hypothetical protein
MEVDLIVATPKAGPCYLGILVHAPEVKLVILGNLNKYT